MKSRLGSNNNNFGHKWTQEQKDRQSLLVKEKMNDPDIKFKVGSANRGRKFSAERVERMHGHRNFESYSREFSEQHRRNIGLSSSLKFTPEYKTRQRKTMVEAGYWVDLNLKTDYEIYFRESEWVDRMIDLLSSEDLSTLKIHGMFHNKTNRLGLVRDHSFSRWSGFISGVFPEILRHPVNCRLILHSENVRKRFTSPDSIILSELFSRIKSYSSNWKEQEVCMLLISRHENGERWKRGDA